MALLDNVRIMGLILQQAAAKIYTEVASIHGAVSVMNFRGTDSELPPEGDLKALMQQFSGLVLPKLNTSLALSDVMSSTEAATPGLFTLPATSAPITFTADGPIPLNTVLGQIAVSGAVQIFRLSLFVKTVNAGDNLSFDVLLNDVSLLLSPISVSAGSNQVMLVNSSDLTQSTLSSGDILSFQATAGDAEDIACTLWITPNE